MFGLFRLQQRFESLQASLHAPLAYVKKMFEFEGQHVLLLFFLLCNDNHLVVLQCSDNCGLHVQST